MIKNSTTKFKSEVNKDGMQSGLLSVFPRDCSSLSQKQSSSFSSSAILQQHIFLVKVMDIVTPILNIVSLFWSCKGNNRCFYLLDLQENKDALSIAMEELKDARDDVKRKVDEAEHNPNEPMKCNQEVSGWLQRVQAIEGEVVKVIQKADQDIQGRCFGGYCPKNCWTARKIGKLVIRKLAIVNDLRSKGSFGDVAFRLPPPLVQKEAVELTLGMESMFGKVWRWLADDDVRTMGLYGYGGVGKTTLLKQINNEFVKSTTSTTHGFDVVILVVVSKVINIDAIQKEIGDRLGLSSPNEKNIRNALSKKNFLLLLDDIWERVDLQRIGIPLLETNKSKVVFTTRSETVCGLMEADEMLKVECLPWNEAWSLFQEKVGERALNSFPRARELAKDLARECGGLPLALITIGRAMSSKKTVQEWNHAITTVRKSASDFPGMSDEVLPLLKLSYDNLREDRIKSCFLYCALFPEDEPIKKAELIDYWIGEGLILLNEFDHIDEARNHGYDIIGNLKGACLLESGGDEEMEVKMHDTIRDLALWITCECGRSKRDKIWTIPSDLTDERSWHNAKRIYLTPPTHDGETEVGSPPKFPNLVTLIYHHFHKGLNFFQFMPFLRVLDLSNSYMTTFPISITELHELRYLSLQNTSIRVLPEEFGKLVKLNYLDLSNMMRLKKIPSGVIGSLLELRVLNLYFCYEADWDFEEVYKLKNLNDLGITIILSKHSTLTKLLSSSKKSLQMCTRHLVLSKHNPLVSLNQQSEDVKPHSTSSSPIITLEKLQLFFNLETLRLLQFPEADQLMNMSIEQQHHFGSCFQNLSRIDISDCNALKDLTWVGYVPNLKIFGVNGCEELEEIISSMNNVEDVFKRLKKIFMMDLPKLKSICGNALAFPCLVSMEVMNCPQLKKLSFDSGSNVNNTLRKIAGELKWWNGLKWEDDHDNNELLKSKFLPYFMECSFIF